MLTRNQEVMNSNNNNNNSNTVYSTRNSQIQEMLQPPEKLAMLKAGEEMKNVWNRSDLSQDEKVKHYTNEMNHFKLPHKTLTTPTPIEMKLRTTKDKQQLRSAAIAADASPATATAPSEKSLTMIKRDEKDLVTAAAGAEGGTFSQYKLIENLPKSMRKSAGLLEDYVKRYPDKVNWNSKGELIYRGETIKDTNISNLFRNILTRTGKNDKSGLFPTSTFTKALVELNVPEDWIRN